MRGQVRPLLTLPLLALVIACGGGTRGTADGPPRLSTDRTRYAAGDEVRLELFDPAGRPDDALCAARLERGTPTGWEEVERPCFGCGAGEPVCISGCLAPRRSMLRRLAGIPGGSYRFVLPAAGGDLVSPPFEVTGPAIPVAALAVAIESAADPEPPPGAARLVGTMVDAETGRPLHPAGVTLEPIEGGAARGEQPSAAVDCDGGFAIVAPPGAYRATAFAAEGMIAIRLAETVTLTAGQRVQLAIRMPPDCAARPVLAASDCRPAPR